MATIHFLEDKNGNQQVVSEIATIAHKAREEEPFAQLSKYIAQALDFLKDVGAPTNKKLLPFYTQYDDGRPLTFASIVKELTYHPPLLEFRVNWDGAGYFRAIFFYEIGEDDQQDIYFTKAILKQEPNPPDFEILANESEQMLKDFYA
jgi:hypothetical protein